MSAATIKDVFSAVSDMETGVHRVRHFSLAIMAMGSGPNLLDADAVYVVGDALEALAARLEREWEAAFALAKEAKQ